jgi:hypothetical protein
MSQSLNRGATVSCGCFFSDTVSEKSTKHGGSKRSGRTPTYESWASMMTRCEWGNHSSYERYGARGIRVCERWHNYANFLSDMGDRPHGTSIDRIDNSNGYYKENCRWATRREQSLNKSCTVRILFDGNETNLLDLCDLLGISIKALRARTKRRNGDYVSAFASFGVKVERITQSH